MNSDIMEGKWKQMKGAVQAKWGSISDDEFAQIEGNRERLVGLLQEKYGRNKDQLRQEVNSYLDSL